LQEALAAARAVEDRHLRAEVLTEMVSHVPDSMQREVLVEALTTAQRLGDERWRAEALVGLIWLQRRKR